ncbi:MAG: peptide chain release factor N(5)-glutamine methyltransferase [Thiomonas arsenitoxydans]|uniref:Release factor glutamine methyltransferase n=1 Tax=Thiomonas arsenitoxydans (strain DSM 22701 / CIP 110005 / 3As) TaxID=426114 RepID=A0A8I1SUU8_THIA3|nr:MULTISPECIES: peptide chain release factor N(5)-glutamine methyltransferase [Thiomonas]MBN8744995.1 peptide chain release factor N(5)-glutamine methyltransferase [Thiomonas arsenitoxydans]ODU93164.1 MAG: protein-(glutamine-N5) methyltransferase, release factor-specific [Thiomonas sp. SCN 64-16]
MTAPRDLAAWTRTCGLPRLDAQALIEAVLGWSRAQQAAHPERLLETAELTRLQALATRLLGGEPLAYVLGEREFFGLSFEVTPDVLIPRPDTELLVELALRHLDALPATHAPTVLDMGTGSGAIAIAIAHARPHVQVWALDASAAALAVAQNNAQRLLDARRAGGEVHFLQSNWWDALHPPATTARFDCIVSNPPYIAAHDPHLPALRHEPALALNGQHPNPDGLGDLRQIIAQADRFLRDDGCLLLEHGYDQAAAVRDLLEAHGYREVFSARDLAGIERVSGGIVAAGCGDSRNRLPSATKPAAL